MDGSLRNSGSTTPSFDATRDSTPSTSFDTTRDITPSTSAIVASPGHRANGTGVPRISKAEILGSPQLAMLCCRAMDAKSGSESILGDAFAAELVDKLNITGPSLGAKPDIASELMCLRAMFVDVDCLRFAEAHRNEIGCTILNLSTGLDTRFMRLKVRSHVRWVEVDSPKFTHLRQTIFPLADKLYRPQTPRTTTPATSSSSSVCRDEETDNAQDGTVLELTTSDLADTDSWLPLVPADRPTLVIMEAGAWVNARADFTHTMRLVVEHFSNHGGRVVFDVLGRMNHLMFRYKVMPAVRLYTFKVEWYCDDPVALGADIHPSLKFLEKKGYHNAANADREEWMPQLYGGKLRGQLMTRLLGSDDGVLFYGF